jgi:hypothetical protein
VRDSNSTKKRTIIVFQSERELNRNNKQI